jgi:hypothetical protein
MAAEKSAKASLFLLMASIMACESLGVRHKTFNHGGHRGSQGRTLAAITENRELASKSHDVIAAIYIDDFAGDAAAGVRGEEDSS